MPRLVFTFALLFLTLPVSAEEINAGFIQGLWYASEPVIAGETTRIYVALRNNSEHDLTSTVRFTDNGERIGSTYVSALPGRIVEAWVDWTPGYGEHTIAASLTNVQVHPIGETPTPSEVVSTIAQSVVFTDHDTDKDGIPNQKDTDDDNDEVLDDDEVARGTDPQKANPKPITNVPVSETKAENSVVREVPTGSSTAQTTQGLETYLPDGRAQDALASLTDTIVETKISLDTYREKRSEALKTNTPTTTPTVSVLPRDTNATITRSRVDTERSFLEAIVSGGKALLSGMYSLLLSFLSKFLAHPALLELGLLLFIVYFIYRTARRYGRRRNN